VAERARRDRAPYDVWVREGQLHTTPGRTIDYEAIARELAEICSTCNVQGIAFDRWRIDVLQKELDRIGADVPLTPWGQGYASMSPALDALEAELLNERIAHGMHPVLTMCAANATTVRDPAGNRKLDKSRQTGRIDGMQALAMAMGLATSMAEEEAFTGIYFV
uniref:terminase TerL endonuclease subunit n=1 Tax=Brachymonas chironomi TaxID=491919 RepID=UPI000476C921